MKDNIEDVFEKAGQRVRKATRDLSDAMEDDERAAKVKDAARKVEHRVSETLEEVSEAVGEVLTGPELERAIDGVGDLLKGVARRLRERRDAPREAEDGGE